MMSRIIALVSDVKEDTARLIS